MNKTAFLCGCGFGNRIGLTPNEAADLTAVREFADTLRKLGGPARLLGDQIDKAAQLAVASLSPEAKADKKHAFETFLVSFDAVPDTVRTLISDEAWQWFSLGHLVYRTSIAKVLKHDADSETAALKSIAGNLAMPQPLKQMFEKFLTEARKTKDPSRCFNAANAFSRTAYLVLDDNSSPRHAGVPSIEPPPSKVFIGHGRSTAWKDLKEFLVERMNLNYEEFNRESTAGITTKERLMEMLEQCSIAFLIMTAEDEQSDEIGRAHV